MTVPLFMLDTDTCIILVSVLDWPQEAAQHYAEIRVDLKRRGAQLGAADLAIGPGHDRGEIAIGKRADLIAITHLGNLPQVERVWSNGKQTLSAHFDHP